MLICGRADRQAHRAAVAALDSITMRLNSRTWPHDYVSSLVGRHETPHRRHRLPLFLYLLIHIAGNLLVFFGPDVFNKYAYMLESNPLLPVIELGCCWSS